MKPTVDEVLKKYGAKIEGQINTDKTNYSKSYSKFKDEISNEYTKYEKLCIAVGNIVKIKPSEKDKKRVKKSLDVAHSNIEPWQALNLAVMSFVLIFLLGFILSIGITLVKGGIDSFPLFFFFLIIIVSIFLFYFLSQYPDRLAAKWRLKASNQMVPAILYVVVYMRHTPNLEKAIAFASQHLGGALALDLKKVFYNVEIGKFSTIKESLDFYLESWRDYSTEFVEGFHLIESSLFEPNEGRRIASLEKALQVVLDGVYGKMLKFSHSVRSPITNVYMLGVVLPTLGLALIPLASAMIGGMLSFSHVFLIFNLIVPFMVFYLTDKVLMMRPGGYGESSLIEKNPLYSKYKSNKGYKKGFIIALPFLILGLIPLLWGFTPFTDIVGLQSDYTFEQMGIGFLGEGNFFGFIEDGGKIKGPFGLGSLLLGMLFPIGLMFFFSIAYREKTKELIVERNKTKALEKEFNNSLFQLGNRLGNGVPSELVFGKVAQSTKGLRTGDFFSKVNYNIRQMGMSVEKAIFEKNRGAIKYYPSDLIATSMRVLIESSKKGLKIAAVSLMSISEYVKNIDKITIRLKDLLAEISSDMKSNMTFLAPLLSGIVVGLAAMITTILGKLQLDSFEDSGVSGLGGLGDVLNIFDYSSMIPPYFLQISVGIYLIQIIFILTATLVTVDLGEDKLEQTNKTGLNLKKGMLLYFITALLATVVLSVLSATVLGNLI
ncbi:MAG: hypothetical protein U9Q99_03390 [Nanoarchaeota archaeon]|nr:hypothetical protein [Nanoarchaeota archaeon]